MAVTNYEGTQKQIIKLLKGMTGERSIYPLWQDFITLAACMISNSVDKHQWQSREDLYMKTIEKYTREEAEKFAKMIALISLGLTSRMGDYIGELYMQLGVANKDVGQFFSPYDVSKLTARMLGVEEGEDGLITLHEPSVGSGGMIIAYAEVLKSKEINYQEKLRVVCNDLDYDVVKMAYIQLSLLGIDAVIMQGNTLTQEMNEVWYTPMHFINLKRREKREKACESDENARRLLNIVRDLEMQSVEASIVAKTDFEQTSIFDFI